MRKEITVGEIIHYMSDTTVLRIVQTSGEFRENEEIIYEEYVGEFERQDLLDKMILGAVLDKKIVGIDCFVYDKDEAGLIIFI